MSQNRTHLLLMIVAFLTILVGCKGNTDPKSNSSDYLPSSWSTAEVIPLCNQDGEKTAPSLIALENEGKPFFNKKVRKSQHEIYVSFEFLSDCCREFDIAYVIEEDILKISYKPTDELPCDCKCDYQGVVNIADKEKDLSSIYRVSIKKGK